ncbi:hypothetical protein, partial [Paraburkholderia elongata]|uniref:hypothetical protein n=1 Tax=Paraburkholderia elongata TaxID=2675747 RepID=UPI001C12FFE0
SDDQRARSDSSMGSLSELADSLTPNVPARMTNLGANSDNLLVVKKGGDESPPDSCIATGR